MKNVLILNQPLLDIIVEKCDYNDLQILQNIFSDIFANSKYSGESRSDSTNLAKPNSGEIVKQKEELEYRLRVIDTNLFFTGRTLNINNFIQ